MKKETYKLIYNYYAESSDRHYTAKMKTRLWFTIPNPVLNGLSPLEVIRADHEDKLIIMIKQALNTTDKG